MTAQNPIRMYDLCSADETRRFSPYCWRIRMALAHKGLDCETIPWHFTDKDKIAFSGQGAVPVIIDGDKTLHESWDIACYLEERYADRPSLFGGDAGRALSRFYHHWTVTVVAGGLFRLVGVDIIGHLRDVDQAYFRKTREQRFGMTMEALCQDRDRTVETFRQSLQPLRLTLSDQPFLGGQQPLFADYIVFGAFQWARCVSPFKVLESNDPVYAWRNRLLAAFDGLAANAKGYPV